MSNFIISFGNMGLSSIIVPYTVPIQINYNENSSEEMDLTKLKISVNDVSIEIAVADIEDIAMCDDTIEYVYSIHYQTAEKLNQKNREYREKQEKWKTEDALKLKEMGINV